jgi:transposase
MPEDPAEAIALFRYGLIAEALNPRLTPAERGWLVRELASRAHLHPDGSMRTYARGSIDRWIRAWRARGLDGLRPVPRSDTGQVRRHPELLSEAAALRAEQPARSAAHIADILRARSGIQISKRTIRAHLRREGLDRAALGAQPRPFGRYEAERARRTLDRRRAHRAVCAPPPGWPAANAPSCSYWSTTTPDCWCTAAGRPRRTPAPARTCSAPRSCAVACPSSCMLLGLAQVELGESGLHAARTGCSTGL